MLVQDGGSTDGTVAAVEAIGDPRVSVVERSPTRASPTPSTAPFARARGEWIAWLNADDLLAPGAFAAAAPLAGPEGVDLVYGDFAYVDERGDDRRPDARSPTASIASAADAGATTCSRGAALFRRSLFERFGGLDTELRMAMDYDFCLRIAPHVKAMHCGATLGLLPAARRSATAEISWRLVRERPRASAGGMAATRGRTRRADLCNQTPSGWWT